MSSSETAAPATGQRYSTRTLLTCAALAAVFAVLFTSYTWYEAAVLATLPLLVVFTSGLWFALPLLAILVVRRPGAAVLTAVIGGLLASMANPYGWQLLAFAAIYAVIVEIPFAVTRWRRYGTGVVAAVIALFWVISLGMYWTVLGDADLALWAIVGICVSLLTAFVVWGAVAWWLARELARILPGQRSTAR